MQMIDPVTIEFKFNYRWIGHALRRKKHPINPMGFTKHQICALYILAMAESGVRPVDETQDSLKFYSGGPFSRSSYPRGSWRRACMMKKHPKLMAKDIADPGTKVSTYRVPTSTSL